MLFNSYIFILLFLPLCLVGYFGLNHFHRYNLAMAFLLGMSLWFYGYFNPSYLTIMLLSITVNYGAARMMSRTESRGGRKAVLLFGLVFDLGILFCFKYFDFFIRNVNRLFSTDFSLLHLLLPLGISFFTFQQISFLVDTYRGETEQCGFLYYASFVAFFPQLVAGPIVSHDELIPQFQKESKKRIDWDNLAKGLYLFTLGLAKKVLIADTFGSIANFGFDRGNISKLSAISAIVTVFSYTMQVYFDFSGYSDMAIGLGKMLNIDLPVNFNSPYKALTITDFWDRWHMTLTRFFTKYVYIPLGGNRRGTARTYINIMIVYLLSGFWHGAGWNFIIWGAMHGILCVITRHYQRLLEKLPSVCSRVLLFLFLNATWVFFRAENLADAVGFFNQMFHSTAVGIAPEIVKALQPVEVTFLLNRLPFAISGKVWVLSVCAVTLFAVLGTRNAYERMLSFRANGRTMVTTAMLLIWCVFSFAGISTFLYFNF